MQPDTEGGRIQRAARKILLSRGKMFIHVMAKDDKIDPPYTKSWADVAESLNNINLLLPSMEDFHGWSKFLLPPENGGVSKLHFVPTPRSCFRGPHSTNKTWRITRCHYLNFGYGEDKDGKLVAHHGVWFGRNSFAQGAPDEISVRQLPEASWQQKRRCEATRRPNQKQTELNELPYLKRKDLYELGKLMSREPGDFDKRYSNPDKDRDTRTEKEKSEELEEVRQILRKNETGWTSSEYYELLRWKMQGGHSVYKTKPDRMKKWQEIVDGLTEEGKEELASFCLPEVSQGPLGDTVTLSRGADPRRVDENEHVDDDEYFEVDDVPWRDAELIQAERGKKAYIEKVKQDYAKDLEGKSEEEKDDFAYQKWWESWDE
jgi:hypothetical protein